MRKCVLVCSVTETLRSFEENLIKKTTQKHAQFIKTVQENDYKIKQILVINVLFISVLSLLFCILQ